LRTQTELNQQVGLPTTQNELRFYFDTKPKNRYLAALAKPNKPTDMVGEDPTVPVDPLSEHSNNIQISPIHSPKQGHGPKLGYHIDIASNNTATKPNNVSPWKLAANTDFTNSNTGTRVQAPSEYDYELTVPAAGSQAKRKIVASLRPMRVKNSKNPAEQGNQMVVISRPPKIDATSQTISSSGPAPEATMTSTPASSVSAG
jgi:hypothetical protein